MLFLDRKMTFKIISTVNKLIYKMNMMSVKKTKPAIKKYFKYKMLKAVHYCSALMIYC